jgi:hypothetical protein
MAAQFDTTRTVLQPTQQEAPLQTDVFEAGAGGAARLGGAAQQDAAQQANRSSQLYGQAINTASAGFDRLLVEYNKLAEENATKDAAGIVLRDGNRKLIPPSSFYPPGISTRAYAERYRNVYEAQYKSSAEDDFNAAVTVARAKYPTNSEAFNAEVTVARQALVTGLDERFKPFLDLRFEQMQSQANSQIAVNVQSEQNRVNTDYAERHYKILADEIGRSAKVFAPSSSDNEEQRKAKLEAEFANNSVLLGKWQQVERLYRAAGAGDAQIGKLRSDLVFEGAMSRVTAEIRQDARFLDDKGNYDFAANAALNDRIVRTAKNFPGREKEAEERLFKAVGYAQQQSQLASQANQQKQQYYAQGEQRDISLERERLRMMRNDPHQDPIEIEKRSIALEQRGMDYLTNTRLNDNVALTLGAYAVQAGAVGRAVYAENVDNRLTGLRRTVTSLDPSITIEQRTRAAEESGRILDSPEAMRMMNSGQRAYAQQTYDEAALRNEAPLKAHYQAQALSGNMSGAVAGQILDNAIGRNRVGNFPGAMWNMQEAGDFKKTAEQAFEKKRVEAQHYNDGMNNIAQGIPTTETQKAAILALKPLQLRSGNATPDFSNQSDLQDVTAHFDQTLIVDSKTKQAFESMKLTPSEEGMAGHVAAFAHLTGRLQQRGMTVKESQAAVGAMIGKDASVYLSNVIRRNAEDAYTLNRESDPKTSITAALGANNNDHAKNMDAAVSKFVKDLPANAWAGTPLARGNKAYNELSLTPLFGQTEQQRVASAFFAGDKARPQTLFGQNIESVEIDETIRQRLNEDATIFLARKGHEIKGQVVDETPHDYAVRQVAAELLNRGEVEMVKSPDGKKAIIGPKTFSTYLGQSMGVTGGTVTEPVMQSIMYGIYQHEMMSTGRKNLISPVVANTINVQPVMEGGKLKSWMATARDTSGVPIKLMELGKDDVRISDTALAITRQVSDEMRRNWSGIDPRTVNPNASEIAHFATGVTNLLMQPLKKSITENKTQGIAMGLGPTTGWQRDYVQFHNDISDMLNGRPARRTSQDEEFLEQRRLKDALSEETVRRYGTMYWDLGNWADPRDMATDRGPMGALPRSPVPQPQPLQTRPNMPPPPATSPYTPTPGSR